MILVSDTMIFQLVRLIFLSFRREFLQDNHNHVSNALKRSLIWNHFKFIYSLTTIATVKGPYQIIGMSLQKMLQFLHLLQYLIILKTPSVRSVKYIVCTSQIFFIHWMQTCSIKFLCQITHNCMKEFSSKDNKSQWVCMTSNLSRFSNQEWACPHSC